MPSPAGPRIAIIGIGKVGAAVAYSIMHKNIAAEILILDVRPDFEDAQVQDLRDATSFGLSPRVRSATWKECGQADLIVFTAGTNQKAGESRLALVQRNEGVIRAGFDAMRPFKSDAVLLMVTNPVDVMTYLAVKHSGLPRSQIFGSGTILDTTRLKDALAQRAGVAPRSVHAYVVGEHGDSQTIAWSSVAVGGVPIAEVLPNLAADSPDEREVVAEFVRNKADRLNKVKGETSFGIGAVISSIAASVLLDEGAVLPLSHWHEEHGICYSTPAMVGRAGIVRSLEVPLDDAERASLARSIAKLKEVARSTEKTTSSRL